MKIEAELTISPRFNRGQTDPRLFGSFIEHMGSTIYNGIYQPDHPSADHRGFRGDVLSLLRELNLTVVRYPGGNFVSGYRWEDGVGPKENRPVRLDPAWRALEPNRFGLDEYMNWLEALGADPLYTINLGTRGAAEAAALTEYCNSEADTDYTRLRKSHGRTVPYGIRTWCLGNEMDGPWQIASKTAEEYGRLAVETAKIMKWIDPEIRLVASGSSLPRMATFPEWDRQVLMHCYESVDYISLHHYVDRTCPPDEINDRTYFGKTEKSVFLETQEYLARTLAVDRQIETIIAACDYVKAVKRSSRTIDLCFDEWNVLSTFKDLRGAYVPWETGCPIDYTPHTMEDLLAFASMMMALVRRADRVKIACQSLLVNTGGLVFAPRDGKAFANSLYHPFRQMSLHSRGLVLMDRLTCPEYRTPEFPHVPWVDTLSVFSGSDSRLSIFAVNRSENPAELRVRTGEFGRLENPEQWEIHHTDLRAVNTPEAPETLVPRPAESPLIQNHKVLCRLKPYSWNLIRIGCPAAETKN